MFAHTLGSLVRKSDPGADIPETSNASVLISFSGRLHVNRPGSREMQSPEPVLGLTDATSNFSAEGVKKGGTTRQIELFTFILTAGCSTYPVEAQVVTPSALKFEVASVKPSTGSGDCISRDPGRFTCNRPLKEMITLAFDVPEYQRLDRTFAQATRGYEQTFEISRKCLQNRPPRIGAFHRKAI